MRLRGCTKTGLPSVARPALLRHIGPQASSGKWPGLPKAPPLGELSPKVTERARKLTKNRRRSDSIALPKRQLIAAWRLPGAGLALSVIAARCHCPGCGSQRLLRCRSHPAGRGPNSSSLFPPLAAVVAVAPGRGASGETVHFAGPCRRGYFSNLFREFVENARVKREEFVNVIKICEEDIDKNNGWGITIA